MVSSSACRSNRPPVDTAIEPDQRFVAAFLDDAAAVEDQQPVERLHRRQPVRDDQRRASDHQPFHGVLDQHLRFRIEAGRGLVEDQDRRICQEGARDRHALALAARKFDAALAHQRAIALRQPADEVVRAGLLCRLLDLGLGGARPP